LPNQIFLHRILDSLATDPGHWPLFLYQLDAGDEHVNQLIPINELPVRQIHTPAGSAAAEIRRSSACISPSQRQWNQGNDDERVKNNRRKYC